MSSFRKSEIYFIFVSDLCAGMAFSCNVTGGQLFFVYSDKGIEMIYRYLKERVKHVVRFRNKRGFGVHSPFMFHFILNVIRDRRHVFVYPEEAERQRKGGARERKFFRLLFRIAVFLKVRDVLCFTQQGETGSLYLQHAGNVDRLEYNRPESVEKADMIYIGRECRTVLSGKEKELADMVGKKKQCVVICDIHKNRFNASLWRLLAGKSTVRVDMMWYGILLFDEKLQKGSYHLIL